MNMSIETSWHEDAAKQARILQVIVAALTVGCLAFLLIALKIAPALKLPATPLPISLTQLVCGFFGLEFIAWMVVMRSIAAKVRREVAGRASGEGNAMLLLPVYPTKTIVSAAMCEGLAFFATIAYLIEGNPICFGLAGSMVLAVAAHFPTQSRIVGWVQRQLDVVEPERILR